MALLDRDYAGASENAVAIDVSSVNYTAEFRRLYVGTAGNVKITTKSPGSTDTVYKAAVGYLHVQGSKVFSAGTSATDIVAEF